VVERTAVNRVVVGSNPTLEELIKYMKGKNLKVGKRISLKEKWDRFAESKLRFAFLRLFFFPLILSNLRFICREAVPFFFSVCSILKKW
jgi:hypothetical protein